MSTRQKIGLFGVPTAVILIVIMLVVPMPPFLLDLLITINMAAALVILLSAMHVHEAKDFSVFPSLLLMATMFRLAINVSVTRNILLHGYAGSVVESFGNFVVGGSVIVGIVVFLILIIIQFVVVTSGAGRVSEVAARFSLDSMAPKLVAIDGELNSGLIDEQEARRRRKDIDETSDFYGNMDGASKFVRGDAIAALIITFINLVGGFILGVVVMHMSPAQAVHTYSILSIGDGLVSQIPALLLSIATGIIVTRGATDEDDFGSDVAAQLRGQPRAIQVAGAAMLFLALVPGLPHLPFFIIGVALLIVASRIRQGAEREATAERVEPEAETPHVDTPQGLAREMRVERLELDLAPNLTPLADADQGGDLIARIRGLRRKLALEKGFALPTVRTRDDIELPASTYVIRVNGVIVAKGEAPPGRMLAIGTGLDALPGEETVEPVFGLPAKWIPAEAREQAITAAGVTAIDRSSAIITHLSEVVSSHAAELLSTQQVQILLDSIKGSDPAVVEELKVAQVTLTDLHGVLVALLAEQVPIVDFVRVVEAVVDRCRQPNRSPEALIEAARAAVGPMITAANARGGRLAVITIDASFEQSLAGAVRSSDDGTVLGVEPPVIEHLVEQVRSLYDTSSREGIEPVLVVTGALRPPLARLFAAALPRLSVMSINEVGRQVQLERIGVVSSASTTVGV